VGQSVQGDMDMKTEWRGSCYHGMCACWCIACGLLPLKLAMNAGGHKHEARIQDAMRDRIRKHNDFPNFSPTPPLLPTENTRTHRFGVSTNQRRTPAEATNGAPSIGLRGRDGRPPPNPPAAARRKEKNEKDRQSTPIPRPTPHKDDTYTSKMTEAVTPPTEGPTNKDIHR
jgi:hypothetical protein